MIDATQRKRSRLATFKRVLVDAAKPPSLSPAFTAYRAATNDAERRATYASLTKADREAILTEAYKSMRIQMKASADQRSADAATFKANSDVREKAIMLAEESRIVALAPAIRHRVEWSRLMAKIVCLTGICLVVTFVAAQSIGEVGYFVWGLFHYWIFWVSLMGANIVIFSIVMIAAHWRTIISVMRAIPSAIYAAITTEPDSK